MRWWAWRPHSLRAVMPEGIGGRDRAGEETARSTSMSPSRRARSRTASNGRARGRSNGCSPMRRVDERWCLIHATHMTEAETKPMAKAAQSPAYARSPRPISATARFPGRALRRRKAAASASARIPNVLIGVTDELRQLEYSQRLAPRQRNVLAKRRPARTAGRCSTRALAGGGIRRSADGLPASPPARRASRFRARSMPRIRRLPARTGDAILDAWIFANGAQGGRRLGRAAASWSRAAGICAR